MIMRICRSTEPRMKRAANASYNRSLTVAAPPGNGAATVRERLVRMFS